MKTRNTGALLQNVIIFAFSHNSAAYGEIKNTHTEKHYWVNWLINAKVCHLTDKMTHFHLMLSVRWHTVALMSQMDSLMFFCAESYTTHQHPKKESTGLWETGLKSFIGFKGPLRCAVISDLLRSDQNPNHLTYAKSSLYTYGWKPQCKIFQNTDIILRWVESLVMEKSNNLIIDFFLYHKKGYYNCWKIL